MTGGRYLAIGRHVYAHKGRVGMGGWARGLTLTYA